MKTTSAAGWILMAVLWLPGCGQASGRQIHVASASRAELIAAAEADENIWYEFRPGDVVPAHLGFVGATQGGADKPVQLRAERRFFLVKSKHAPMRVSFDGKSFAGQQATQMVVGVLPREEGRGGELLWAIYLGESGDPEAELMKLVRAAE